MVFNELNQDLTWPSLPLLCHKNCIKGKWY